MGDSEDEQFVLVCLEIGFIADEDLVCQFEQGVVERPCLGLESLLLFSVLIVDQLMEVLKQLVETP